MNANPPAIHIATDHAGLELSAAIQSHLRSQGFKVTDHGPASYDPQDDYPSFCFAAAEAVVDDIARGVPALGLVIGGSGNGEQIAANKVVGVRAVLIWNDSTARLAREHNDANVAGIGARQHDVAECLQLVDAFVRTPFTGEVRHARRIAQIQTFEEER